MLAAGILVVFAAVVAVLLKLMPGARTNTDYLVIGGIATFVSMVVLFVTLITSWMKRPDVFFRKRAKSDQPSE